MRRDSDTDSMDENDHGGALASDEDEEGIRVSTPNPELSGLASHVQSQLHHL